MKLKIKTIELVFPEYYQRLKSMPDDPPSSVAYGFASEHCECVGTAYPTTNPMPFGNSQNVIQGIHKALADNQALIEVKCLTSNRGRQIIYSIVKTHKEPYGVQYCLTFHENYKSDVICVQAFFDEKGMTGLRDTIVYNDFCNAGLRDKYSWMRDPYDPGFKRDYLMNLSEVEEYDKSFPGHPLSLARGLVKYIVEHS